MDWTHYFCEDHLQQNGLKFALFVQALLAKLKPLVDDLSESEEKAAGVILVALKALLVTAEEVSQLKLKRARSVLKASHETADHIEV